MLTINDRIQDWEINSWEKTRLLNGDQRVFEVTEKSFICEHCKRIIKFHLDLALSWCIECHNDVPRGDLLLTDLEYRIMYHLGEEKGSHD